jgi:NadR type nicotinamide-nucleotide adenylyltransferase
MTEKSIIKIAVIGPESTGKSTLCKQLAQHYNTSWCPEFAREYLHKQGAHYTYDDLLSIAKGQVALEEKMIESAIGNRQQVIFIDTDLYVMKVWSEFVFGKCHQWILEQIVQRKYDLYLLCKTDLPWVKDELREYPDLHTREKLYSMYKDLMINQSTAWVEIGGNYEERLQKAVAAVDHLLAG